MSNKLVAKVLYYFCWIAIILTSFTYISGTDNQRFQSSRQAFYDWTGLIIPNNLVDPMIIGTPKIDPSSTISTNPIERSYYFTAPRDVRTYSNLRWEGPQIVEYKNDFEEHPQATLVINLLRLSTFIGIVLFFFLLAQLLRSVAFDRSSIEVNHNRLINMGSIIINLAVIRVLHSALLASVVRYNFNYVNWELGANFSALWLITFGLVLIAFGIIYKESAKQEFELDSETT